jgi:NAD(P)-dependent dehydrogenase (short-subunit alcohol dehydrogenase family)
MLSKALIHLMKPGKVDPSNLSKIVNISARVGSITDNSLGGWYSYRMSKAALNMFTKTLSVEVKRHGCVVLSLHPGTTDTDLSLPFQKNVVPGKLFPVEYSVNKMLDVIWNSGLDDTGKVFAYDGSEIPY